MTSTKSLKEKFEKLQAESNTTKPASIVGKQKPKPRPGSIAFNNNPVLQKIVLDEPKPTPVQPSPPSQPKPNNTAPKQQPAKSPAPPPSPVLAPAPVPTPAPSKAAQAKQFYHEELWQIQYDELELEQVISSGIAGEVYLGYYFGTPVAIKKLFLEPTEVAQVESEYKMLKDLHHPNIVQFLGLCLHETGIYLVTEYVEHGDLFDLITFGDVDMTWAEKNKIALQIAQACHYLHSKNIIHRDLKSLNVLVGDGFKVKLCDLGLAAVLESRRTTICGTNQWMAPEVMIGEPYDFKADVFSFGIVLTELITNKPPENRSITTGFQFEAASFKARLPADCPPALASIVLDCTKADAEKRPSFRDVLLRLRNLQNELQ